MSKLIHGFLSIISMLETDIKDLDILITEDKTLGSLKIFKDNSNTEDSENE